MRIVERLLFTAALLAAGAAVAHHPGSHAVREGGNRIRVEAVAIAGDDCTGIEAIAPGAPALVTVPPGAIAVTARLKRREGACNAAASAVRGEQVLELPLGLKQIFLYVQGPDGKLVSSERVPVQEAGTTRP